jgi:predicted DNA-binding protein
MNVRTTKVYSITMPPEMAKQAERLARKESRTMSELMREAFRRYQQQEATKPASMVEALALLRAEAKVKGLDKLTKREINAAVAETRREMATTKRSSNRPGR